MKSFSVLIAIGVLALAAPAVAQSPAAPRVTPYEGRPYDSSLAEAPLPPSRSGGADSMIYNVPPVMDPIDPMRVVPPPATPQTRARDRLRTQTQFENQQRAITERSRRGVAQPSLGIPGQQPWGVPSQPSPGVPGQQRPAWQPKQ